MSRHTLRFFLTIFARVFVVAYLLAMIVVAVYLRLAGDVTGLGMLLLFGPRWWLLAPWALLLPISLLGSWRVRLVAGVGVAITLFAAAGFEIPNRVSAPQTRRVMRLVTYNTDRSAILALTIRNDLARWNADVVVLQDCKTVVAETLKRIPGVFVHVTNEFCLVSRFPVEGVDEPTVVQPSGGHVGAFGKAIRYRIRTPSGVIPVYAVHLQSPRDALWAARNLNFERLRESIIVRRRDSHMTSEWVRRTDSAFVVAGDFNLPYGSDILRNDWGDLTNAFAEAGVGFGYTMFAGHYAVRIDHVMVPKTLMIERVELLRGYPSEHQPVVVDIGWKQ